MSLPDEFITLLVASAVSNDVHVACPAANKQFHSAGICNLLACNGTQPDLAVHLFIRNIEAKRPMITILNTTWLIHMKGKKR